jgi:hypothetical protein
MKPALSLSLSLLAAAIIAAAWHYSTPSKTPLPPTIVATRSDIATAPPRHGPPSPSDEATPAGSPLQDACQESDQSISEAAEPFLDKNPAWLHASSTAPVDEAIRKIADSPELAYIAIIHEGAPLSMPKRLTLSREEWLRMAREHSRQSSFNQALILATHLVVLFETRPTICPAYAGTLSLRPRLLAYVDLARSYAEHSASVQLGGFPSVRPGKLGRAIIVIDHSGPTRDQILDELAALRDRFDQLGAPSPATEPAYAPS